MNELITSLNFGEPENQQITGTTAAMKTLLICLL
jgi:hypothetical protein